MSFTVEQAVFRLLSTYDGVSNLVSSRVYPVKLPQNPTYPAITFFRVSGLRHSVMGNDTGVVEKRIQVSSWSEQYSQANALAEQVRDAMQRFRGEVDEDWEQGDTLLVWTDAVTIQDIFVDGDGPEIWEDEINVYQFITDFNVIYEEQV